MDRSRIDAGSRKLELTAGWFYAALIIILCGWILRGFAEAMLAAGAIAAASWPIYSRFRARLPLGLRPRAAPLVFTTVICLFVLLPMIFAFGAVLSEAHALLLEIAAADRTGIAAPAWLQSVPLVGPWLASRWQGELSHPGAL